MGRNFKHLTLEQRKTIESMHRSGSSAQAIAEHIGVSNATVYRELNRGKVDGYYQALKSQERYEGTLSEKGRTPIIEESATLQEYIRKAILEEGKSIRRIAEELSQHETAELGAVSYATIYRAIELGYIPQIGKETFLNRLATIQKDGSLYIPKWFTEKYGLKHSQQFEISFDGEQIILVPLKES